MREGFPESIGGRYRAIRLLGSGGMGLVYEVEHIHTGARLALKLLSGAALRSELAVERFRREARVSASVRSENIVRVIDADSAHELGGIPYLVMELLTGEDLGRFCGDEPQRAECVVQWLQQAARGLDKAHAVGITHCDLKPANFFLSKRDDGLVELKILDFGIAEVAAGSDPRTLPSEIVGTPAFMAPEQIDVHFGPITPRTDRFALGLIAYRLLTGRHYWTTQNLLELAREICLKPMPAPSTRGCSLGPSFDAWFARACHRDAAMRFDSAGTQIEALAQALGARVTETSMALSKAVVASPRSAPGSRAARHYAFAALGIAVAAALLGWTAWPRTLAGRGPVAADPATDEVGPSLSSEAAHRMEPSVTAAPSVREENGGPARLTEANASAGRPRHLEASPSPAVPGSVKPALVRAPAPAKVSSASAAGPAASAALTVLDPFADQH